MQKTVKAPAKINLTLDVIGKRADGYHEVEMIMTTIDLADRITLTELEEDVITIESTNGFVPNNEQNIAYGAAKILKNKFAIKKGISIFIHKKIPISAGLAGGSTDAAAVLRGLNDMWNLKLTLTELAEIGLEIGSDVPFCVHGGTVLAKGRGEELEFLPAPPPSWVVLVKPPISVSTRDIYGRLNLSNMSHPDTSRMIKAIKVQNFQQMCDSLGNVMEDVTFDLHPQVKCLKERMDSYGAAGVAMSGTGPTVFALTKTEAKARRIENSLKGFIDEVFVVRLLGHKLT